MVFTIESEPLPKVFEISVKSFLDDRGSFHKIFQKELFSSLGINFEPKEYFYSVSKKNVIRGMHFQIENASHEKLVYCSYGNLLDVVVDVRKESKNFNKPISIELNDNKSKLIFIGKGYAHGFLTKSEISTMHYFTSTVHNPNYDKGVLWNSINFDWPVKNPILSKRDMRHPLIKDINFKFL